jgi:putative membrane protein insertion efficiency factor
LPVCGLPTEKVPSWELNRMMEPKPMSAWVARVPRASGRALIKAYRYTLSPLIGFHCRHLPTCSEYADQALQRYGLWAGGWMTLARLLRTCPGATAAGAAPTPRRERRHEWNLAVASRPALSYERRQRLPAFVGSE